MTITFIVGMPKEASTAKECFLNCNVIQYIHSPTFQLGPLVPQDCSHIISFGLCGGLAPNINVGDIVIGSCITDGKTSSLLNDESIYKTLNDINYLTSHYVSWYSDGNENEANSVDQRKALFETYATKAIDDESYYGWKLAQERNIKFSIIRSVSDDWSMNLPPAATGPIMNIDGSANTEYLISSIEKNPSQLGSLIEVGWDFGKSLHTLYLAGKVLAKQLV